MQVETVIIYPNASLDFKGSVLLLGSLILVMAPIGAVLAGLGYWLVLPFMGLELVALAAALYVVHRGNQYREMIRFQDNEVIIGAGTGAMRNDIRLSRAWTRIELLPRRSLTANTRLVLSAMGRRVEVGSGLTERERAALCVRLRELQTSSTEFDNRVE